MDIDDAEGLSENELMLLDWISYNPTRRPAHHLKELGLSIGELEDALRELISRGIVSFQKTIH